MRHAAAGRRCISASCFPHLRRRPRTSFGRAIRVGLRGFPNADFRSSSSAGITVTTTSPPLTDADRGADPSPRRSSAARHRADHRFDGVSGLFGHAGEISGATPAADRDRLDPIPGVPADHAADGVVVGRPRRCARPGRGCRCCAAWRWWRRRCSSSRGLRYLPIAEAAATAFVAPLFVTALSIAVPRRKDRRAALGGDTDRADRRADRDPTRYRCVQSRGDAADPFGAELGLHADHDTDDQRRRPRRHHDGVFGGGRVSWC